MYFDNALNQKGLKMTKKNPDDSVREEQSGTPEGVAGTEDAIQEKKEPEAETITASEALAGTTGHEDAGKVEKTKKRKRSTVSHDVEIPEVGLESSLETTELPPVDYSGYSKHDLVETLVLLIENRPPSEIRDDVDRIKGLFYRKLKQDAEERKNKFLEGGGKLEEYRPWVDPDDAKVKHLLEKYREKKTDYSKIQEAEKFDNLKKKYEIIDKIKDLVNREESINKTFHDFRALQNEWHAIGVVSQASLKDLWENYHHTVEVFYDYIKINKELRDLDLKKNLESKVLLCEKAETLLLEPNPVNAFRALQDFHNQWREIGPVPQESKNDIWERFKEATAQINKRHHEYFEKQKDDQKKNLDAKIALCEEVETINQAEMKNFRDFDEKADKVV